MIGGDDSSARKRLREVAGEEVQKFSDLNHMKKNFGNWLYELKGKGHSELSQMVINYTQKIFQYAVTQNKGNPEKLKETLLACVPHMYSDHSTCGEWCRYSDDPSTYTHKGLPHGKDLKCQKTKEELQ